MCVRALAHVCVCVSGGGGETDRQITEAETETDLEREIDGHTGRRQEENKPKIATEK